MQKNINKLLSLASSIGLVLTASSSLAGTKTWDFNTDPTTTTALIFGGSNEHIWQSSSGVTGGFLALTYSVNSQNAVVIFPDIDNGNVVTAFDFDCDLRIGNPQTTGPADGFSINFARATDNILVNGADIQYAAVNGQPENGTATGLAIGFDTWAGNTLADGSGDLVGIIVAVDNKVLLKQSMPTVNGEADDTTSMQTGPRDSAYWSATGVDVGAFDYYGVPAAWAGLQWRHLSVKMTSDGKLTIIYKGKTLLDAYQTSYFASAGQVVLMGRTGGSNEHTHFDNITLTTTAVADNVAPSVVTNFKTTEVGAGHVNLSWNPSVEAPDATARVVYNIQRGEEVIATSLQTTNYQDLKVVPNTTYAYKVQSADAAGNVSAWTSLSVTTTGETDAIGVTRAEIFYNIDGTDVASLTGAASFLDNKPDRISYCSGLTIGNPNGNSGWSESFGDYFGARVTGTITPLASGSYHFFIRSDDASAFYLNTAGATLPDPASATPLMQETDCCSAFVEPGTLKDDATSSTTATPVTLTAGKAYGFTLLLKEGSGGDGVGVAWRLSTDTTPAADLIPIAGSVLAGGKQDTVGATIAFTQIPDSTNVFANQPVTLTANATATTPYGNNVSYQWFKDGAPISMAYKATYTLKLAAATDSGKYKVTAISAGAQTTSSEATLTVTTDTKLPELTYVTADTTGTTLQLTFSEPVTAASIAPIANYVITPAIAVSAATVVDAYTVKLTIAKLTESTVYTLTVNGIKDNAGNTIAADTKYKFQSWGLQSNYALMEQWNNISGGTLDALYEAAVLSTTPNATRLLAGLTTGDNTGENYGDNYGARIKAYLIPTETASYNFYIRSDDASALFISQNETFPDPSSDTPVCTETDCCEAFVEPGTLNDDGATSATTSTPVALTAGKKYAVLVTMKEGTGGDFFQVAMQKSTGTNAASSLPQLTDIVYWYGPAHATNILSTKDTIVASSANTPPSGGENAPNVLDGNSDTKYLNFDKLNTGFTVTPALGATIVTGIQITTGGDEPPRDPATYQISGSIDGVAFTEIASGSITHNATRKAKLFPIYFANTKAYNVYRVIFPTVYSADTANSMQVADVALLGNYYGGTLAAIPSGSKPKLAYATSAGKLVITFEGTLQSSSTVDGTWTDETATSPWTVTPTAGAMKFYRAKK
jgi:hypothetical protein